MRLRSAFEPWHLQEHDGATRRPSQSARSHNSATKRGNGVIRGVTRRRHAASHLLMLQNPHRRRCGRYCEAGETGGDCTAWPRRCAAGPGRTTSRRAEHTSATQPHWCGGRRRDQRARASCKTRGLAAAGGRWQGQGGPRDRPLRAAGSRVAISRAGRRPPAHTAARPIKASHAAVGTPAGGRAAAHRHTQRPGPTRQATRRSEHQRGTSNKHAYKNAHPEPGGRI